MLQRAFHRSKYRQPVRGGERLLEFVDQVTGFLSVSSAEDSSFTRTFVR